MMKYFFSLIALLLFCSFFAKKNYAADRKIFNIKNYGAKGNGLQNDHDAFIRLAKDVNENGGNCLILIPKGKYKVGKQIKGAQDYLLYGENLITLKNCKNVEVNGNMASIIWESGFYYGSFEGNMKSFHSPAKVFVNTKYAANTGCVFLLQDCSDIYIHDLNMDGRSNTYKLGGKFGDTGVQLTSDGILAFGSTGIHLARLNITNFGRDGFMVGIKTPKDYRGAGHNIEVNDCKFTFNGRQGVSIIGGVGFTFTNCEFSNTGQYTIKSMPCSGVDVEAELGIIRNVRFKKCKFINNKNTGLVADSGDSEGIEMDNCLVIGMDGWSIYNNKPKLVVKNTKIYGSIVGAFFEQKKERGSMFSNCYIADTIIKGKQSYGGFVTEINGAKNLKFVNCVFNAKYKKAIWIEGRYENTVDEQPLFDNCFFNINIDKVRKNDYILVARLISYKNTTFNINCKKENLDGRFLQTSGSNDLGHNIINFAK